MTKKTHRKGQKKKRDIKKPAPLDLSKINFPALQWIAFATCLLTGIAFSFKNFREPDLWWMLKTGHWILANMQIPRQDMFSYTLAGTEWINVKWGFEVLVALLQKVGGPAFIYVLQAVVTCLLIYFWFKASKVLQANSDSVNHKLPWPGEIIAILLALVTIEFRIIGRPETISHLFTGIFLFFLLHHRLKKNNLIFIIPLLQILWTNLHEAYGTGLVMMIAFTAGSWFDYYFAKQLNTEKEKPIKLTLALNATIVAVAINPRGPKMILHPLNIYSQLGANQFTTELFSFTHPFYWEFQAYLNLIFFALTVIFLLLPFKGKLTDIFTKSIQKYGSGYILFLAMFFYLSLTAYRNIPFFIIVSMPLIASGINELIVKRSKKIVSLAKAQSTFKSLVIGCLILGIGLHISVASDFFYKTLKRNDRYGLKVSVNKNPVRVADFIINHHISGRCFSDYLVSSYLLWKIPDFKTFIDLRDLDVFPVAFFEKFTQIVQYPEVFDQADSLYHFDYVVLYRTDYQALHQHLLQSKKYALVFADPVALLYVKQKPETAGLIEKYGYQKNPKEEIFHTESEVMASSLSTGLSKVFWPPYNPDEKNANYPALASSFYFQIGNVNKAIEKAKEGTQQKDNQQQAYIMLGNIYLSLIDQTKDKNAMQNYLQAATSSYTKALDFSDDYQAYKGLGVLAFRQGRVEQAQDYFQKCIHLNGEDADCYSFMARTYQQLAGWNQGNINELKRNQVKYLEKALAIKVNDPFLELQIALLYCDLNECAKAGAYLDDIKGFPYFNQQQKNKIRECRAKCQRR